MDLLQKIKECELFADLGFANWQIIQDVAVIVTFNSGEHILHEGRENDNIYLILEGSVEVRKAVPDSSETLLVCTLGAGDSVGEMSFLKNSPVSSSSSVISKDTCKAIKINHGDLVKHSHGVEVLDAVDRNINKILSEKLQKTTKTYAELLRKQSNKKFAQYFGLGFLAGAVVAFIITKYLLH